MDYIDKANVGSTDYDLLDKGAVRFDSAQTMTDAQKTQAQANIGIDGAIGGAAVRYDAAQSLTSAQKTQARTNIGIPDAIGAAAVRYDAAQTLTEAQQTQARGNIGAADGGDVTDIKNALSIKPNVSWTIGKEITNAGVPTISTYSAYSSKIPCAKNSRIINDSAQKDGNNYSLVTYVALYRGGAFVRRDSIPYNTTYVVEDDVTSIILSIGRYSSSGISFQESDLQYFSYTFLITPEAKPIRNYMPTPGMPRTKYRYIWHDNFHRGNTSGTLGTNGDTQNPMAYEYAGSQLVVSGDKCVNTSGSKGQAYADMQVSDCIIEYEADLSETEGTTRGAGVIMRRTTGTDFLYCQLRRENIKFGKSVSGTITELKNISVTSQEKSPIKVSVVLDGSKITICTNGVEIATIYESFNQSATAHGLYIDAMNSTNNPIVRNFGVKIPIGWQTMMDAMDRGELPYNIAAENAGQSYNFSIQDTVVCGSKTALRFENRKTDNNKRSEIAIKNYGKMLDEQFYEWDTMLGADYAVVDPMSEIIMQMHDITDDNQSVAIQPSFSLYIKDGKYYVHTQSSPYHSVYDTSGIVSESAELGSYLEDVEEWTHWTLHVKWAYNDFFEPLIELFKNGALVYKSVKPNVVNAAAVPYFKIGMYTFNWVEYPESTVATVRTMYVDNIRASY